MHEHDTDLIMSLAQGELDESAAARAEAEMASCARCSADLELHRSALEAVAGAPRVYLTATESARLRSAVRDELRLKTPAPAPRRRRFPLAALAGAAAVLLAIVIAGPAMDLLDSGDAEPAATFEDALAPPVPEETPGTIEAAPQAPREAAPLEPAPPQPEAAAGEAAPSLAAPLPGGGLRRFPADTNLEELRMLVVESGGPQAFLDRVPEDGSSLFAPQEEADRATDQTDPATPPAEEPDRGTITPAALECDLSSVSPADTGATPTLLGFIDYEGSPSIVVAYAGDATADTILVVLAVDTCEVLATA